METISSVPDHNRGGSEPDGVTPILDKKAMTCKNCGNPIGELILAGKSYGFIHFPGAKEYLWCDGIYSTKAEPQ